MMDQINAPYNFVPLSDKVVIPEWGDKVSHDLPFKDGVSGELELTVTAQTDILVGGEQQSSNVHFFQAPDGKYAIPGSSLRGMFRNVVEIATFSRMNAVDEKSYGLRDISTSGSVYHSRVVGQVRTGFLSMSGKRLTIVPCEMARLDHRDLEAWLGQRKPIFNKRNHKQVARKYAHWLRLVNQNSDDMWFTCSVAEVSTDFGVEHQVTEIGAGNTQAFPVLTGQINDSSNDKQQKNGSWRRGKHKDFVFYNLNPEETIDVHAYDRNAWKDFLFIHHDAEESSNTDMSWPNHWRAEFRAGRQVPVFYLQSDPAAESGRLQIGLAYLPKLAGDFSTYDLIRHTSDQHLQEKGFDFTSLVFGRVGKEPDDALKGRVYFEPAVAQGDVSPVENPPATILNGAKPSYFPNYIKQTTAPKGNKLAVGKVYATYLRTDENQNPQVRGWKRYPARPEYKPEAVSADNNNTNVQTRLHVLPKDTQFKSRVVFHNLKPEELGALLWSIHLEGHRHGLGMGKSFGAGQVTVDIDWDIQKIMCNDSNAPVSEQKDYLGKFMAYMQKQLGGKKWNDTEQVRSLLAMTYAEDSVKRFKGKLEHMKLRDENRDNQFVKAKQAKPPLVLAAYDISPVKHTPKYEKKNETWENASISYEPGAGRLTASLASKGVAVLSRESESFQVVMGGLVKSEKKKAQKNQLIKSVEVKGKGNALQILGWVD